MKPIPKETQALMSAKAEEARGLLDIIKPLSRKAATGKLTRAELDVFSNTIHHAASVLHEARAAYWKADDLVEEIDPATGATSGTVPATNGKSVMVRKLGGGN